MFAEHLLRFHQDVLEYEKSARDIEARRDRAGEIFAAYLAPKGGHDVELDVPSLFEIKKNLALDKKGRPQQKEPGTLTYAFHTAMVKIFMRLKFECVNRTLLLLRCLLVLVLVLHPPSCCSFCCCYYTRPPLPPPPPPPTTTTTTSTNSPPNPHINSPHLASL